MNGSKFLFLDDNYLSRSENAVRVFHAWEKDPENPVITKKFAWEGIGPYCPSAFRDENGLYGMWAGSFGGKDNDYPAGFMTSGDGLNWERRSEMTDAIDDGAQCCACFYDEGRRFGKDRYLGAAVYRETNDKPFCIGFKRSSDAEHWESFGGSPRRVLASDVIFCMWDGLKQKYVMYYKLWKVAGTALDGSAFCAYFPAFDPTIDGDTFRARGLAVLPEKKRLDVALKFEGDSPDDGGGGIANKSVTMIRVIARAESDDFIDWHDEKVILEPPEGAPLGDQTYGMTVQLYNGMYIGHVNHFNGLHGHIRPLLAWSYDGVAFSVNRGGFALCCGEPGAWDAGMVLPTVFFEDIGGRMCLYYGAQSHDHKVTDTGTVRGNIGRAWMRKDGFASLKGGKITTVPFEVGGALSLNMTGKIGVKLIFKDASGDAAVSGIAEGDGTDIVPDIDLRPFIGKKAVAELDLQNGELYALNV